jgi:hypothetical protein
LKRFFGHLVPDARSPKILQQAHSDGLQSSSAVQDVDFSSQFTQIWIFFSEPLKAVFVNLNFVNGLAVDTDHANFDKSINDSHEILLSN